MDGLIASDATFFLPCEIHDHQRINQYCFVCKAASCGLCMLNCSCHLHDSIQVRKCGHLNVVREGDALGSPEFSREQFTGVQVSDPDQACDPDPDRPLWQHIGNRPSVQGNARLWQRD
jgi:hypothetical protein